MSFEEISNSCKKGMPEKEWSVFRKKMTTLCKLSYTIGQNDYKREVRKAIALARIGTVVHKCNHCKAIVGTHKDCISTKLLLEELNLDEVQKE